MGGVKMNSKQMEILFSVAKTLNFTKSAEELFLSQPTLTYQNSIHRG